MQQSEPLSAAAALNHDDQMNTTNGTGAKGDSPMAESGAVVELSEHAVQPPATSHIRWQVRMICVGLTFLTFLMRCGSTDCAIRQVCEGGHRSRIVVGSGDCGLEATFVQ